VRECPFDKLRTFERERKGERVRMDLLVFILLRLRLWSRARNPEESEGYCEFSTITNVARSQPPDARSYGIHPSALPLSQQNLGLTANSQRPMAFLNLLHL
jgi:hypothetical protein